MTTLGGVAAFLWYLVGLVLLFGAGHWVWGIFGIILPIIPYVYTVAVLVDKFLH